MKGDKITVTETTCASASERFNYLACRHVNGIDGWQHGVVLTALRLFTISSDRIFHTLGMKHMIRKHIPSSMKKYNFTAVRYPVDAQQLLHMAQHETSRKPSVAYQHTALLTLQIAISRLSRPYQGCLPSCKLHMHS